MADSGVINSGHEPNSVQSLLQCPLNFGRKTEGKGAGSRSAWRFDLLWRIVCEIVCCASVPQPYLNIFSPAATAVTSSTVENLGVVLDSNLSFENHISYVTKTAFFHLRNIALMGNM